MHAGQRQLFSEQRARMSIGGDPACWAHLAADAQPGWLTTPRLVGLLETLGDAVVITDVAGDIVFWNAAAQRLLGWTATEAIGQSLDLIIPERQRPAHWAGYRRVMAGEPTHYAESLLQVPALDRAGQRRSVAFTVTLLADAAGSPLGIAAVMRDDTERRTQEQALRARIAELEGKDTPI